ncbi:flagellar basal body P-ring biosynthesis protein FlgA [Intrasporangium chromatireducens Q5-1]|uniref:Flagellar basal body P-ring biosynthesis protein FlgA n=1 Tax=Intrasporangium chromatireducens Q5-1 TaxID=584657 RepID=W9GNX1_9MICO|nr:hypothetical protein [Intrasporangium chromatireducens]EWT06787.1 flagellar basal body P-ring biosynthesis protein FlgA [Intrasporangium chromatireducens Q5-1]
MSPLNGSNITATATAPSRQRADLDARPIAPPPKLRRRPLLVLVSVAAVIAGALLAVWAYTASPTTHEVVAVRATIQRGGIIDRADLMLVRVTLDPALNPVDGSRIDALAGQHAALDLPAGGLVTDDAVTTAVVPAKGQSVVGISLPPALLPGEPLRAGDDVRVVATPGEQGEVSAGEQRFIPATVVGVHPNPESGQSVVSVQVPYAAAAELAARAATGKVALVLDSRER